MQITSEVVVPVAKLARYFGLTKLIASCIQKSSGGKAIELFKWAFYFEEHFCEAAIKNFPNGWQNAINIIESFGEAEIIFVLKLAAPVDRWTIAFNWASNYRYRISTLDKLIEIYKRLHGKISPYTELSYIQVRHLTEYNISDHVFRIMQILFTGQYMVSSPANIGS